MASYYLSICIYYFLYRSGLENDSSFPVNSLGTFIYVIQTPSRLYSTLLYICFYLGIYPALFRYVFRCLSLYIFRPILNKKRACRQSRYRMCFLTSFPYGCIIIYSMGSGVYIVRFIVCLDSFLIIFHLAFCWLLTISFVSLWYNKEVKKIRL